jgi:hypothetical protein
MIREYSKSFSFEHGGMDIDFTLEYNLESEYGFDGQRQLNATDFKYSDYTVNGSKMDDETIKVYYGNLFLESLDKIATEMVEEAQLDQ